MTKSVKDNAIFLSAMLGEDIEDAATKGNNKQLNYLDSLRTSTLRGKRLGVIKELLTDSIYRRTIQILKRAGAELVEFEQPQISLNGFLTLLNIDMKYDLPKYLNNYGDKSLKIKSIDEITECYIITGEADFLIKVVCKDIPTYEQLLFKTLSQIEEIERLKINDLKNPQS